jgi:hypothetical protein
MASMKASEYRGDGQLSKLKFLLNPGVQVDFEKFVLNAPYKAHYRIDGLPPHRSGYFVGMAVDISQADDDQHPRQLVSAPVGTLGLRLRSKTGRVLFDCTGPVDQLQWSWVVGERLGRFAGRTSPRAQESFIFSDYFETDDLPSALEVSYEPLSTAPNVNAWIRLSAGGQK